jgi:hypothetical protein
VLDFVVEKPASVVYIIPTRSILKSGAKSKGSMGVLLLCGTPTGTGKGSKNHYKKAANLDLGNVLYVVRLFAS